MTQDEEMFNDLINTALENKHSKWEYIRSMRERLALTTFLTGIYKVVKLFKKLRAESFKAYKTTVLEGADGLELLLAYRQFKDCVTYYEAEANLAEDMINEFDYYALTSGHLFGTLLFDRRRSDDELEDYRKTRLF